MSEKKKFSFEEGHKRETRKSYQQYLKEVSMFKSDEPNEMDDESIRRSKRTPVPKRGFKLIDDYDSKETPKKKGKDTSKEITATEEIMKTQATCENGVQEKSANSVENVLRIKLEDNEDQSFTKEDFIDEPRRSGRVRKPKQFEKDENNSSSKRGSGRRKLLNEPAEVSADPVLEESPKKTACLRLSGSKPDRAVPLKSNDAHQILSGIELVKLRRKQPIDDPTLKENSLKEKKMVKKNIEEEKSSKKGEQNDGRLSKKSPIKRKLEIEDEKSLDSSTLTLRKVSRRLSQEEAAPIKQEVDEPVAVQKRSYESYVSTGSKVVEQSLCLPINPPLNECTPEKVPTCNKKEDKISKKLKEKSVNKPSKSHRKPEKLIISFKKNTLKSKFKKEGNSSYQPVDSSQENEVEASLTTGFHEEKIVSEEVLDTKQLPFSLPKDVDLSLAGGDPNKSRKKKKKNNTENNEKIVSSEVFSVEDTHISKVKKKKIYKRRNGEKVLVRLIKNYCNREGQVVRTESIHIDNTQNNIKKTLQHDTGKQISISRDLLPESSVLDDSCDIKQEPGIESAPLPSKKKILKSQKNKAIKKPSKVKSRPANRVVTKNGKVVGKTTKGMKKTGVPTIPDAIQQSFPSSQLHETPTEPKNAYNLFCRKYRSYVKEQYPDADFSEISRKLANLWQMTPKAEKKEHRDKFAAMQPSNEINKEKMKLARLNTLSPIRWSDAEFKYIKEAIQKHEPFDLPRYTTSQLTPSDLAAHLQLLGESLNSIGAALHEQSTMNVHGAMSVLLDSILCAVAPLSFITSFVPEMRIIEEERQARILDNITYILPGL